MKKKKYCAPQIVVQNVELNNTLLAGSPQPSSDVGVKADGEGIGVASGPETGRTPSSDGYIHVDEAKGFNAWETWDNY